MIPDQSPCHQKVLEQYLRELADLVEHGTIDPRQVQVEPNSSCRSETDVEEEVKVEEPVLIQRVVRASDENSRPGPSYIDLIGWALSSSPMGVMRLSDIYDWIKEHYPFYKTCKLAWKNSVRHALSVSKLFERAAVGPAGSRGGFWTLTKEGKEVAAIQPLKAIRRNDPVRFIIRTPPATEKLTGVQMGGKENIVHVQEPIRKQTDTMAPIFSGPEFDDTFHFESLPMSEAEGNLFDLVVDADGMIKPKTVATSPDALPLFI